MYVSYSCKPVTHVALVAVKNAVNRPHDPFPRVAKGSESANAPATIIAAKLSTTTLVGLSLDVNRRRSFFKVIPPDWNGKLISSDYAIENTHSQVIVVNVFRVISPAVRHTFNDEVVIAHVAKKPLHNGVFICINRILIFAL